MSETASFRDDSPIRRHDVLAWGTVRSGLGLTFFGGLLLFLCSLPLVVVQLTQEPELRKISFLVLVVVVLSLLGLLAGLSLIFTGVCMTTSAPASRSAPAHRVAFSRKNGSSVPATR